MAMLNSQRVYVCVCVPKSWRVHPRPFRLRSGLDFLRKWSTDFANPEDWELPGGFFVMWGVPKIWLPS